MSLLTKVITTVFGSKSEKDLKKLKPFVEEVNLIYPDLSSLSDDELKIKCQPVAINSGYTWPKKENLKANLTLTISILKPIEAGMNKEKFLEILQNKIYSELDNLN